MAEHSTRFHGPETQEAFLADRTKFFGGFINATVGTSIFVVLLLIGMGVFLLYSARVSPTAAGQRRRGVRFAPE